MSSADYLGRQTSFSASCTRLHDALAASGAQLLLHVEFPLDRRAELHLTLRHEEVETLAEILERYVAWVRSAAEKTETDRRE